MRARGLTLIEVLVALALVSILFGAAVYSIGAITGARAKENSTELAGVIRNLYDTASLTGQTCRLVFDLPEERDEEGAVTWRAECAKGGTTASRDRDQELKEIVPDRKRNQKVKKDDPRFSFSSSSFDNQPSVQELQAREKRRVEDMSKFSNFSSEEISSKTLPANVRVEVWTAKQKQKSKNGTAYLYFFPQGYTERAQVWVKQGSNTWTLAISPLTGKTVIFNEDVEIPRT